MGITNGGNADAGWGLWSGAAGLMLEHLLGRESISI